MMKKCLLLCFVLLISCSQDNAIDEITWHDFENKPIQLKTYKGKWVIVNYWATWCAPCIKEMPILQDYYQQSNGNTVIIGANIEHADGFVTNEAIIDFTKKLNLTFPIVKANINLDKVSLGKIKALPTTVIINPKGDIVHTYLGEINKQKLDAYVSQ